MAQISVFGEPMLELSTSGAPKLAYGGDTLNTAVYLTRLGAEVDFITALGVDDFSDDVIAFCEQEGIAVQHILRHPERLPGLYAIKTDAVGEKQFFYWRSNSAAKAFFDCPGAERTIADAEQADWLYLTGISLAILDEAGRARAIALAAEVRANGGQVAFDPNYRPRLWQSRSVAADTVKAVAKHVSLALPSLEDEIDLFGQTSPEEVFDFWRNAGAQDVALKSGAQGCFILGERGVPELLQAATVERSIDTTGAGDSFNAALLHGLMSGHSLRVAATSAMQLAALVVRHRGAILPRDVAIRTE